jgi:hypothetical protein
MHQSKPPLLFVRHFLSNTRMTSYLLLSYSNVRYAIYRAELKLVEAFMWGSKGMITYPIYL